MRKQVFILTIFLTLATSSSWANSPMMVNSMPTPNPFPPNVKKVTQNPAKLDPPAKGTPSAKSCTPENGCLTSEQAKKKFEEKMTKNREDLYCKLGLTPEQKAKAEALDATNREAAKPLMCKLRQEKAKLHELQQKKACLCEIYRQKQQVQLAKKALKDHFAASRKCFEAILTEEQLAKFKTIRAERKAGFQKHHRHHCRKLHGHPCNKPGCPCHSLNK